MPFAAGPWELASVLSKVLSYASLASLVGGLLVFWLGSERAARPSSAVASPLLLSLLNRRYLHWPLALRQHLLQLLLLACLVGSFAALLFFLLQVGVVNQTGVAGMFDSFMAGLLLQSPIGYGAGLKLTGFLVAAVTLLLARPALLAEKDARLPVSLYSGALLALVLFAASFAVLGHVASLGVLAGVAIAVHISAMGLWIGALYPLHTLCRQEQHRDEPAVRLQALLQTFGRLGWAITGSLLLAGGYLLTQLLEQPADLLSTPYGLMLTGKLLLVVCLLGLAALNKFRLVPALAGEKVAALQYSIRGEMGLAFLILVLTACLTTFTGPVHLL
ncbi:MAG: CopD family protein [Pseudomonadota bacterium]